METGKSSSGWVGAAALGLGLFMACLDGGAGQDEADLGGPIRDAGGPDIHTWRGEAADTASLEPRRGRLGGWKPFRKGYPPESPEP